MQGSFLAKDKYKNKKFRDYDEVVEDGKRKKKKKDYSKDRNSKRNF